MTLKPLKQKNNSIFNQRKRSMKNIFLLICFIISTMSFSQVGISSTPAPSAELEVSSTTRGFLVPRLLQVNRNLITNTTANLGMIAYTTNGAAPGMYYIQSNITNWTPMSGALLGWPIVGRAGTTAANYVGTTAVPAGSADFIFKTNNTDRIRLLATSGFIGIGTALPSTVLHLSGTTPMLRIEDGTQGANKIMVSDAAGVMTWASQGSIFSPDWDTFGNPATTTDFIGTLSSGTGQDFIIKTNATEKMRVQADGNIRIGSTAPANSQLEVVGNMPNNSSIKGVNTNTTPGTFSFGVQGGMTSLGLGSNALQGFSSDLGLNIPEIGILGSYQLTGAGVFGRAWNIGAINTLFDVPTTNYTGFVAGRDYGVFGNVGFFTGTGVYGINSDLTIGSAYGVYSEGNFAVSGTKSASVPTTQGNQLVYCKESPEMWFEDFGFAQLKDGTVHVKLENLFLETVFIDDAHKMHVVLQEQAESKGLYFVVDADHKGFTVKEKKGGNSDTAFSYSIMAKRRFYQDHRFGVDSQQPFGDNLVNMKDAEVNTTDINVKRAELLSINAAKTKVAALQNAEKINK